MKLFDCNAVFGVYSVPPTQRADTVCDLLDEMSYCGIDRALVRQAAQLDETPVVGNPLVCEQIAGHPGLEAAWVILPFQTGEMGTLPEFIAGMGANGVRSLWAYPSKHRYLLNATTCGDLFDEMVARRIPLFLPKEEQSGAFAGWALAEAVLSDFPKLRLVVVGHGSWGEDRYFRPLMERYEHFYTDTSRYELDGGIAEVCKRYGPERLLFGTAFPGTSMGAAMLTLLHCDMPDEYKEAVAAGNLERLLGEVNLA